MAKSCLFFSNDIPDDHQEALLYFSNFNRGHFPCTYLGVPLFVGRVKIEYFSGLEDKIRKRIGGWMQNLLTMGGKFTLIDAVLNAVRIHCMSILPIPKTVLAIIRSLISSFLWDKGRDKRRHWVRWEHVCREKSAGGFGIEGLDDIMLALHAKMAWGFITSESLWANYARSRLRMV
ncbi:hypothetical protein QQ045_001021 [Rhodiola kirilowii]